MENKALTPDESLETKIKVLQTNVDVAIKAMNVYLDMVYSTIEQMLDENGKLRTDLNLPHDEKAQTMVEGLPNLAERYEKVRRKLLDKHFNLLSLVEIQYVSLSMTYVSQRWQSQISDLQKATAEINDIIKKLMVPLDNSQNLD